MLLDSTIDNIYADQMVIMKLVKDLKSDNADEGSPIMDSSVMDRVL